MTRFVTTRAKHIILKNLKILAACILNRLWGYQKSYFYDPTTLGNLSFSV